MNIYIYVMTEKCANKLDVVLALRDTAKSSFSVVESISVLVATSTWPPNRRIRIDQCLRSEVNRQRLHSSSFWPFLVHCPILLQHLHRSARLYLDQAVNAVSIGRSIPIPYKSASPKTATTVLPLGFAALSLSTFCSAAKHGNTRSAQYFNH